MKVIIPSPGNFEAYHGPCAAARAFLDAVEQSLALLACSPLFRKLQILLLLAPKEEILKGKFQEFIHFDWKLGYAAVGVNGDYEKYLHGDDADKIAVLYEMLLKAVDVLASKKKAKFDGKQMRAIIEAVYVVNCYKSAKTEKQ